MYTVYLLSRFRLRKRRGATALEYAFLVIFIAWIINWARFMVLPVNQVGDFLQNAALPHP